MPQDTQPSKLVLSRYYSVTTARPCAQDSKELMVRSFEMGVLFLPSLLGRESQASGSDDDDDGDDDGDGNGGGESFTCTPGEMGLTQRFPLTYACEAGRALPLKILPLPYRLPGEIDPLAKKGGRGWSMMPLGLLASLTRCRGFW